MLLCSCKTAIRFARLAVINWRRLWWAEAKTLIFLILNPKPSRHRQALPQLVIKAQFSGHRLLIPHWRKPN